MSADLEVRAREVVDSATPVQLTLLDTTSYDEWRAVGRQLARVVNGAMWWLGDWWAFGEHRYGERAAAAAEDIGWSFQTCANAASVARAFETSRRREVLSWSHHAEVAALDPVDADDLLAKATKNDWSTRQLRTETRQLRQSRERAALAAAAPIGTADDEPIQVVHADALDLLADLPDGSVDLLLTDPPYRVTDNAWDAQWAGDEDFWEWTVAWLSAARPKMGPDHAAFVFCDADWVPRMSEALTAAGYAPRHLCVWHHRNLVGKRPGSGTFAATYEAFWHCGGDLTLPDEWSDDRWDVQTVAAPQSNGVADRAYHPTQKPLELMRRLVRCGSPPGGLVLDPFAGSGTTAVACRDEGRRCLAGDQDDEFVRVAWGRLAS